MKLNIGCAEYRCDGWSNIDAYEGDGEKGLERRPDILAPAWDIPLPDGCAERIYLGHVLEHMDLTAGEPQAALTEARRLLAPNGQLLAVGPDVVVEAENVYHGTRPIGSWSYPTDDMTPPHLERGDWEAWTFFWSVHGTSGVGTMYPSDHRFGPGYQHRWNCTAEALYLLATGAGLTILDRPDVFDLWRHRDDNGWTPVVSGAPGQVAILAAHPDALPSPSEVTPSRPARRKRA